MKFEVIMRCVDDSAEFPLAEFEAGDPQQALELSVEVFEELANQMRNVQVEVFEKDE